MIEATAQNKSCHLIFLSRESVVNRAVTAALGCQRLSWSKGELFLDAAVG